MGRYEALRDNVGDSLGSAWTNLCDAVAAEVDESQAVRILNTLARMGVCSAELLSSIADEVFLREHNFGKASLEVVRDIGGDVYGPPRADPDPHSPERVSKRMERLKKRLKEVEGALQLTDARINRIADSVEEVRRIARASQRGWGDPKEFWEVLELHKIRLDKLEDREKEGPF